MQTPKWTAFFGGGGNTEAMYIKLILNKFVSKNVKIVVKIYRQEALPDHICNIFWHTHRVSLVGPFGCIYGI